MYLFGHSGQIALIHEMEPSFLKYQKHKFLIVMP